MAAIEKNWEAPQYIKDPAPAVQLAAVRQNPEALRYIESPTVEAADQAIGSDARTLRFVMHLTHNQALHFLGINVSVLSVLPPSVHISEDECRSVLSQVLARTDVPEKYVRNLIGCRALKQLYHWTPADVLRLIYHKGSCRAKQIAVDERLRFKQNREES